MHRNLIIKLAIITILSSCAVAQDDASRPGSQLTYVSPSNPMVIRVANYAAQQIQRGHLFKIFSAQAIGTADVTYYLVLDVVDAHSIHHRYQVNVFVPANPDAPWKVLYFTAMNY